MSLIVILKRPIKDCLVLFPIMALRRSVDKNFTGASMEYIA